MRKTGLSAGRDVPLGQRQQDKGVGEQQGDLLLRPPTVVEGGLGQVQSSPQSGRRRARRQIENVG